MRRAKRSHMHGTWQGTKPNTKPNAASQEQPQAARHGALVDKRAQGAFDDLTGASL